VLAITLADVHRGASIACAPVARDHHLSQRGQHCAALIGEHEVGRRVIALYQISDEQVLSDGMGHARLRPVCTGGETEKQYPFRHGEFRLDRFSGHRLEPLKAKREPVPIWAIVSAARRMNGFAVQPFQGIEHRADFLDWQPLRFI
jgi:hypothetical protein